MSITRGMPCACGHCSYSWNHPDLFGGYGTIGISGVTINCPRCGEDAHLLDGVYRMQGDFLEAVVGLDVATAGELRDVVEAGISGAMSEDDVLAAMREISPKLAGLYTLWRGNQRGLVALIVLGFLLAFATAPAEAAFSGEVGTRVAHEVLQNWGE